MLEKYPDVMTLKQCQEILGVGKNLILALIHDEELPAFRVGYLWRVCRVDLINFIRGHR